MFHVTSNLNKFSPSKPVGGEQRDFRSVLRRHSSAHEQPKFLTTLRSVEVSEGDRVKLQVKVIGTPHPKVTWCHDNEEIKVSVGFLVDTLASLKIKTLINAFNPVFFVYKVFKNLI